MKTISSQNRAGRVRRKIRQISDRPRVSIQKTNRYLSLQLIDDQAGRTVAAVHERTVEGKTPQERRVALCAAMAVKLKEAKMTKIVFDRGANRYHGVVAEIAEGLRANGIEF